jgi:hypothetical protein
MALQFTDMGTRSAQGSGFLPATAICRRGGVGVECRPEPRMLGWSGQSWHTLLSEGRAPCQAWHHRRWKSIPICMSVLFAAAGGCVGWEFWYCVRAVLLVAFHAWICPGGCFCFGLLAISDLNADFPRFGGKCCCLNPVSRVKQVLKMVKRTYLPPPCCQGQQPIVCRFTGGGFGVDAGQVEVPPWNIRHSGGPT